MSERESLLRTFLFTDIEGSTKLWQDSADAMSLAVARHDELIAQSVAHCSGELVKSGSRGDAALAAFTDAAAAFTCAVGIQRAFGSEPWPRGATLRVRSAIHTGAAEARQGDYFGTTLNRAARLLALAHGGQVIASRAAAEAARTALPDGTTLLDLGEHLLKDLYEPERVFQVRADGLQRAFAPLASAQPRAHHLPAQLSSFVGRERELADLDDLISSFRLVTISGVGGAGKTRLAVQAGSEQVDRFADGVHFVDLAPVRDSAAVARTFAVALDVNDPSVDAAIDDPVAKAQAWTDYLVRTLRARAVLLVVDNCEHVLDECASTVTSLLAACAKLRVLATSREPLGVAGEHLYRAPPLSPPTDAASGLEALRDVESVRLFCDRSRGARADFRLTADNVAAVAQICRQLDGIPLAIELAAARTQSLSPAQIAERLSKSSDLLASSGRQVVDRHRTLEAALEWSYDALSAEERVVLRRLAVFTGGWSLDAAEWVAGADPLTPGAVLDLLSRLVDRSLVVADDQVAEVRYRSLEPVRQFAERKLAESDEADVARIRHQEWFVRQAGAESFSLYTAEGRLAELLPELDNFRTALRFAIDSGDAAAAMRMAGPLNSVFVWAGQRSESDAWLTEALEIASGEVSDLVASTIGTLAANLDLSGDVRRAVDLQRQAASMFEQLGNRSSLLWSLVYLGHSLHFCAQYEEEYEVYEHARVIAAEVGDKIAMSLVPFLQSWMLIAQGRTQETRDKCREALEVGDEAHPGVRAAAPAFTDMCDFLHGDIAASQRCDALIQSVLDEFVDAAGNEDPMGLWLLHLVGNIELTHPVTRPRARVRLADLLARARRTGLLGAIPDVLDAAAVFASLEGDYAAAACVCGAVARLRRDSGIEMRYAVSKATVDAAVTQARVGLGTRFDHEFARGVALSLPETLDLASGVLTRSS
ncbi:MAG TPA: NB-ARC domain-containing protein [Acidimicrobiales bacterium]|nr:NB-ARC domain-containing protein [Acidimicrobiales bacterium]